MKIEKSVKKIQDGLWSNERIILINIGEFIILIRIFGLNNIWRESLCVAL